MKSYFYRTMVFLILIFFLLFFFCTVIPGMKAQFGWNEDVSIGEKTLSKVLLAKACDENQENCLENVILFFGAFDQGTIDSADDLLSKLNQSEVDIDTVCFSSPGGRLDTAIRIGNWIERNSLNTCLAEEYIVDETGVLFATRCNSACPFVFLMGETRTQLGDNIDILIHHSGKTIDLCIACWRFNSSDSAAYDGFSDMLLSSGNKDYQQHIELLEYSLKTHFSKATPLTNEDLLKYSIFTN